MNVTLLVEDTLMRGNWAADGGAAFLKQLQHASFASCTIADNYAESEGAGLYAYASDLTIDRCRFSSNRSEYAGGAVCLVGGSASLTSCLLSYDYAPLFGSAIRSISASVAMTGCTVRSVNEAGWAVYASGGGAVPAIRNTILWNGYGGELLGGGDFDVSYSILPTAHPGDGNLVGNPLLTPDGHLQPGSPCLNAGDPAFAAEPGETDIDGDARVAGGRVDIGCDESVSGQVPGDIDGDGLVNAMDLLRLARGWGKTEGDADYDAACDLTGDGRVDAMDLLTLARNWPY